MNAFLEWAQAPSGITYGNLLEAFGVGVGLYLALAIIQAVAGFRISILTRRIDTLRKAVVARKLSGEYDNVRAVSGRMANVEIQLDGFFNILFKAVVSAFSLAIALFTNALISQNAVLWNWSLWCNLVFLLWLPLAIFFLSAIYIRSKCGPVGVDIDSLSDRVQAKLFDQLKP